MRRYGNVQVWTVQDAQDAEDALKKFRQRIALRTNRDKPENQVGRVYEIRETALFGYEVWYTLSARPIWMQARDIIRRELRKARRKLTDEKRCPRVRHGLRCDLRRGHRGEHQHTAVTTWETKGGGKR